MTSGSKHSLLFFGVAPMSVMLLYVVNNFYLKPYHYSWVVGKISDFCFCFFFPLYVSSMLTLLTKCRQRITLIIGCYVTLCGFSLVKLSPAASSLMNDALIPLFKNFGVAIQTNQADATDLMALPLIVLAYHYGKIKGVINNE